jgi:4-hydroxy-3-methylbut-2-enyl diphosphate reductase
MQVISIRPRGFCPGVTQAIHIVKEAAKNPSTKRPIYILGMIVHNSHVVRELERLGVITLDSPGKTRLELLELVSEGTVVITAHGVSDRLKERIKAKGLSLIDATCKDVYRTHDAIKQRLEAGDQVLFIGKRHHPETEAVLAISPDIILIGPDEDIADLPLFSRPIYVTNQTTLSMTDIDRLSQSLIHKYPSIVFENELCDSTRIRQEAILSHNKNVDLCYIVGDHRSNNTASLVQLSREKTNTQTRLIESVADIDPDDLKGVNTVSVSSGASTPSEVTEEVIAFLRQFPDKEKGNH